MDRYRFVVSYDGTEFAGWQVQPGQRTVQSDLEKAFSIALRTTIRITGAGRTDSGVHASGMVAHFDHAAMSPDEILKLEKSINAITERDLAITKLEKCTGDFHARYSALWRHYIYRIATHPMPLLRHMVWHVSYPIDTGLFNKELKSVLGRHDFLNFSIPRNDGKSTHCNVMEAGLEMDGNLLMIEIKADRFLHKMVRSIIGACFDVARKRYTPGLITEIMKNRFQGERTWAPAIGLNLDKVGYPDHYA